MTGPRQYSRRTVLAGLAASGLLAACRPRPPVTHPELVWASGSISADGPAQDVARMWNDRRIGPPVRVMALPESADDQHQLLAVELGAGVGDLDILELDIVWTPEFASNGWLADLGDVAGHVARASLPSSIEAGTWDGDLWAAPYTSDTGLLYYRTDLIGSAPPAQWTDLSDRSRTPGRTRGAAPLIADGNLAEGLVVLFLEYFWSAGGEVLDANGDIDFAPGPALAAINFLHDGYRDGYYAPGFERATLEEARAVFQNGSAIALRSWPYAWDRIKQGGPGESGAVASSFGLASLPVLPGGRPACALGGHNLAVNAFSGHVAEATEFVRFVAATPEVQRLLIDRHSLAPTLRSVYTERPDHPVLAAIDRALPTAKARPALLDWSALSKEIQLQLDGSRRGDIPPQQAVAAIRSSLETSVRTRR